MTRIGSTLRASFRALAFVAWTALLFGAHLLNQALLPAGAARRGLARLQRTWARGTLRILGARLQVEGAPPPAPFFLVANHLSYVDVAVLHSLAPCSFVVKAEVARWPVFGWLTRATGHVFLRRERRRDLPGAIAALERRLDQGGSVTIFAEATSSPGARVLPFRSPLFSVAARCGKPVHYAALSYRTPPGTLAEQSICWWGDMSFLPHFWELLRLPGFEAQIRFGARPLLGADRRDLARRAHAAVSARLVPVARPASGGPLSEPVQLCLSALHEGIELLEKLDDALYLGAATALAARGIGPHVRHLVEFFEALLRDLSSGWIDYDRRARDPELEINRSAALHALRELARRLAELRRLECDPELHVRQDAAGWVRSCLSRELVALHSHAVHHYSLIALLLRVSGYEVPAELGVAPATRLYWRGKPRSEARV